MFLPHIVYGFLPYDGEREHGYIVNLWKEDNRTSPYGCNREWFDKLSRSCKRGLFGVRYDSVEHASIEITHKICSRNGSSCIRKELNRNFHIQRIGVSRFPNMWTNYLVHIILYVYILCTCVYLYCKIYTMILPSTKLRNSGNKNNLIHML